jgi:hypothetical protein
VNAIDMNFAGFDGNSAAGEVTLEFQAPGIGGSTSPPGPPPRVVANVDSIGAECRRALPATSSDGPVALSELMIAGALAVADRRRSGSSLRKV